MESYHHEAKEQDAGREQRNKDQTNNGDKDERGRERAEEQTSGNSGGGKGGRLQRWANTRRAARRQPGRGRVLKRSRPAQRRVRRERRGRRERRALPRDNRHDDKSEDDNLCERCRRSMMKKAEHQDVPAATESRCVQAGSQCVVLSALCERAGPAAVAAAAATAAADSAEPRHCEVTPEIIVEALKWLTKWRQNVHFDDIVIYLMRRYPVQAEEPLRDELAEKLTVAAAVDIVCQNKDGTWQLHCALVRKRLTTTHVTAFWEVYGDTMRPVNKKEAGNLPEKEVTETTTNTRRNDTLIEFDFI